MSAEDAGQRLDVFLSTQIENVSRSYASQLARLGRVQVNAGPAKPSLKIAEGDDITVDLPSAPGPPQPETLPLDVVYEDEDVVVVNKPAGMVVHPAPGHTNRTLVNAILARHPGLSCGDDDRPGIVHRLDKETSGLLVVALHEQVRSWLVAQFKTRAVHKEYVALVAGHPPLSGLVDSPIGRHPTKRKRMAIVQGGRPAATEYEVVEYIGDTSLILARPLTGRTHQIRVHMDSWSATQYTAAERTDVSSPACSIDTSSTHRSLSSSWRTGQRHALSGQRCRLTSWKRWLLPVLAEADSLAHVRMTWYSARTF